MNKSIRTNQLDRIVKRLVERFHPDEIILFGSHARGTAGPDSDYDLLVVTRVTGSRRAMRVKMRLAVHDLGIPIDVVVATRDEVETQRNIPGTLIRSAVQEGRPLYAGTP